MESVSKEVLEKAIQLLGDAKLSHDEVEEKLRAWGVKEMEAQRLASFVPEAFGMVAALNMKQKPAFLPTFTAGDTTGVLEEIPFSAEPIFGQAVIKAETMHKDGPKDIFDTVSMRSSVMEVIQDAMEKKSFYTGAIVAIESGVPAEVYRKVPLPFWKRILRQLGAVEVHR